MTPPDVTMLTCPMCKKAVRLSTRECPTCRTDLSLLADYVDHVDDGLSRADALTREGELAEAVWAYLAVLEVDPDNPTARRQVGQVAAAVRQFDRIAVGRRWLDKIQRQARFRRWTETSSPEGHLPPWVVLLAAIFIVALALLAGWYLGSSQSQPDSGKDQETLSPPRDEAVRRAPPRPQDESHFLVFPRGPGRLFVSGDTPPAPVPPNLEKHPGAVHHVDPMGDSL